MQGVGCRNSYSMEKDFWGEGSSFDVDRLAHDSNSNFQQGVGVLALSDFNLVSSLFRSPANFPNKFEPPS